MSFTTIVYAILGIAFLNTIIPFLMNQLGVSSSTYLHYLFWLNALFIFFLLLPSRVGQVFDT